MEAAEGSLGVHVLKVKRALTCTFRLIDKSFKPFAESSFFDVSAQNLSILDAGRLGQRVFLEMRSGGLIGT